MMTLDSTTTVAVHCDNTLISCLARQLTSQRQLADGIICVLPSVTLHAIPPEPDSNLAQSVDYRVTRGNLNHLHEQKK